MLKNYFTIAYRILIKNKIYTVINIVGLASGLACFLLIAFYVADELSYDRYNEKADRIYRINSQIRFGGSDLKLAVASDPMGATLKKDYPQVEEFVRFYTSNGSKLIKKGNAYINEDNVVNADSTLFNVFTLPAIAGDTKTALNEPNTVVISESAAKKYFGSTDAVGKMLETNEKNGTLYKVTAVIKDIPPNSHFHFDFIFSMDNVEYGFGNYLSHNFYTYLLLKPYFNDLSAKNMAFPQLFNVKTLPFLILLPVFVGFIAGSYPAFYLSSFNPVKVLKGNIANGAKNSRLRSILVVFQFTTSIILIIATTVVYKQLHYIQNKKLGFNKDEVLIIDGTGALGNNSEAFKNEISKLPSVISGTFTGFLPGSSS